LVENDPAFEKYVIHDQMFRRAVISWIAKSEIWFS
jgi:hypothetical protein